MTYSFPPNTDLGDIHSTADMLSTNTDVQQRTGGTARREFRGVVRNQPLGRTFDSFAASDSSDIANLPA